jgi:hypothetical protein
MAQITTARLRGSLRKLSPAGSLILGRCGAWSWRSADRLAQVAVTALKSDGREWAEVAGRRFGSMSPPHTVKGRTDSRGAL